MADEFCYNGISLHKDLPDFGIHSFELYTDGRENPIAAISVVVRGDEAATTDTRIAIAHERLAAQLRCYADMIESAAADYDGS